MIDQTDEEYVEKSWERLGWAAFIFVLAVPAIAFAYAIRKQPSVPLEFDPTIRTENCHRAYHDKK